MELIFVIWFWSIFRLLTQHIPTLQASPLNIKSIKEENLKNSGLDLSHHQRHLTTPSHTELGKQVFVRSNILKQERVLEGWDLGFCLLICSWHLAVVSKGDLVECGHFLGNHLQHVGKYFSASFLLHCHRDALLIQRKKEPLLSKHQSPPQWHCMLCWKTRDNGNCEAILSPFRNGIQPLYWCMFLL